MQSSTTSHQLSSSLPSSPFTRDSTPPIQTLPNHHRHSHAQLSDRAIFQQEYREALERGAARRDALYEQMEAATNERASQREEETESVMVPIERYRSDNLASLADRNRLMMALLEVQQDRLRRAEMAAMTKALDYARVAQR